MKKSRLDSFGEFVCDQLRTMPELECRSMFSSHGLYSEGAFFGIISGGKLYFKTNAATVGQYKEAGMEPFAPSEKQVLKNYYEVPVSVLENGEELCQWAEQAVEVMRQG